MATGLRSPDYGVPNPPYTNWPNLCSAGLHARIELPGVDVDQIFDSIRKKTPLPAVLPHEFIVFWLDAYAKTYNVDRAQLGIDADALQSAYAIIYLVIWLQTAGAIIPCMPSDQINYPDNCGQRPSWVAADGSVVINGQVRTPPQLQPNTNPSVAEIVSGILLAILGLFTLFAGAVAAGILELGGAIALIADGATNPDWDQLRCHIGWVSPYFYNLTNALHELLKWGSYGYPYSAELAHNSIYFAIRQEVTPPDAALNTVQSLPLEVYPLQGWSCGLSDWIRVPTAQLEAPAQIAYPNQEPTWPFHFVDGLNWLRQTPAPIQENPLRSLPGRSPLIRDDAEFKNRQANLRQTDLVNMLFGNALDVSLELLQNTSLDQFLNWDLDGDPGYGFPTWQVRTSTSARSSSVPEP
jgi:hypothetical protein